MVRNTWMQPPLLAKLVRHGWTYKSLPKLLQTCNPSSNYLEKICGSVEQIIRDPFLIVIKIQVERLSENSCLQFLHCLPCSLIFWRRCFLDCAGKRFENIRGPQGTN